MPQGGKPIQVGECPVCSGPFMEILWRDGFGMEEVLERHCNQCGYAEDGEGNIRYEASNEALLGVLSRNKER